MDSDYKEAIERAESIDKVVGRIKEKYSDPKTNLEGDNWLLEYSVLNWGTDFLRPYKTLVQMQECLEKNVGNWGIDDSHINGSSFYHPTNGGSPILEKLSGRRIVIFQVSSKLLVPMEITRLPASNPERPNGYKVEISIGMEREILNFEFNEGGRWGYMKDSGDSATLLVKSDQIIKYSRKVADSQFESSTPPVLIGQMRHVINYFGSRAKEKISEWLDQHGYIKGEKRYVHRIIKGIGEYPWT